MMTRVLAFVGWLLSLHALGLHAQCAQELTLSSPKDYQVFQRSTPVVGLVPIRGLWKVEAGVAVQLEGRVIADSTEAPWRPLHASMRDGQFEAQIETAAGGWYRLEVRGLREGKVIASSAVEHVGVGEVFVVAGQSNSANHGEELQKPQTGRVAAFDGKRWQLANDPQPGASGNRGSFLPVFGDEVVRRLDVPVGLVACGIGATSVREWLPKGARFPNPPTIESRVERLSDGSWQSKGDAFTNLIERMKSLGETRFRAVLWHQGESDANQKDATRTLPGDLYRQYLAQVIQASRREIGWDAPWFVAQASYHVPGDEGSEEIRKAQQSLWIDGIALKGPDSDALRGDLRERQGQGVHFSGKGLRVHGEKWADQVVPWIRSQGQVSSDHRALPKEESKAGERTRPNIVFIYADDWGWGDLSCHGNEWLKTPNIDRLAREGVDFQQFLVLNPVCSPSRTALMTGKFPARFCIDQHFAAPQQNRQRNMPDWLDPRAPTLPRFFRQSGYRTGHFGKWHLTNRETYGAPTPDTYGIDEAKVFNGGAEWPSAKVHETAENTVAFIRANQDQPFFVNVWLHESHTPHAPSEESMERWKGLDEQKQVYAAVITDGDRAVGKILDVLKETGLEKKTIVVFSSDNGPEWTAKVKKPLSKDAHAEVSGYDTYYSVGETNGLRGRKRSLFEGGIRVPFIVRWPGHVPAGKRDEVNVITAVDVLPTLCTAAEIDLPSPFIGDGENRLEALLGKQVARTKPIFWKWTGNASEPDYWPRLAVREGDWKLLLTSDGSRVSLHRVTEDRSESNNQASEHPELVARLSAMAIAWSQSLPTKPDEACIGREKSP